MTPVCPACRAPIALDAHACGRCGLAVRPTCASCGEPLMHGMESCWFCREPIEEVVDLPHPPPAVPSAAGRAVSVASPPVQVAPPAVRPSVPVFRERRRRSSGGAVLIFVVSAVFVVVTLLAIEMSMPRFPSVMPASVELDRRSFDDLGFSISYPAEWRVNETKDRVSFVAPEPGGGKATRGLRIDETGLGIKDVIAKAKSMNQRRFDNYRTLGAGRTGLGDHDAVVFAFVANDLRFEQWWVRAGTDTIRLEFWSRPADDDAPQVNRHVAQTLTLP